MKRIIEKAMHVAGNVLLAIIKFVVKSMLRLDRKVIKKYLGVETPLYRLWWNAHAVAMQKKLDNQPYKKCA